MYGKKDSLQLETTSSFLRHDFLEVIKHTLIVIYAWFRVTDKMVLKISCIDNL